MKITDYLLGDSPPIWATFVAGVFSVITNSLSLFLIFEYLSSYKNPEDLAFDLSLFALLGDNIYNSGELLAHPIMITISIVYRLCLLETKVEWLYYILQSFNSGNLVRYEELCRVHNAALSAQPALVENEKKLLEKINILCLMEIIFSRPSDDRTIPLKVIAERTKLSIEDVEYLLMKSLSVRLIEGIIDQIEGAIHVSWMQPRVLGIPQSNPCVTDWIIGWAKYITLGYQLRLKHLISLHHEFFSPVPLCHCNNFVI
ncbi:hypothetical protein CXB51_018352 [Gossypium anomalum]|uniref:PCI domain-containing protein n=1 Tax=Gossypium anomalum TaxID=47600 RepID=A0A8J6CYC0_9ROSI|nr:hypothetical protein CXB51_018352 [Gossypium anomalum]